MMYWNSGWTPMMLFPMVMALVMLVAVVVAIRTLRSSSGSWAAGGHGGRRRGPGGHQHGIDQSAVDDPQAVLRLRYARGEVTRAEYEELRDESLVDLLKARVARGDLSLDQYESELNRVLATSPPPDQEGSAATPQPL